LSDIRCDFAASPLHSKQYYSIIRGSHEYQRCSKHLGERSTDELTSPRLLTGWTGFLPLNKNPILATGVKDFAFGCTLHTERFRGELPPPPTGRVQRFTIFSRPIRTNATREILVVTAGSCVPALTSLIRQTSLPLRLGFCEI